MMMVGRSKKMSQYKQKANKLSKHLLNQFLRIKRASRYYSNNKSQDLRLLSILVMSNRKEKSSH